MYIANDLFSLDAPTFIVRFSPTINPNVVPLRPFHAFYGTFLIVCLNFVTGFIQMISQSRKGLQLSLVPRKAATPAERWRRRVLSPFAVAAVLACIFLGLVVVAKATGHWQTNLPRDVYMDLVSHAREAGHPGM